MLIPSSLQGPFNTPSPPIMPTSEVSHVVLVWRHLRNSKQFFRLQPIVPQRLSTTVSRRHSLRQRIRVASFLIDLPRTISISRGTEKDMWWVSSLSCGRQTYVQSLNLRRITRTTGGYIHMCPECAITHAKEMLYLSRSYSVTSLKAMNCVGFCS